VAWLIGTHGTINDIETQGSHEFHIDIGSGWCFKWAILAFLVSVGTTGFAFQINLLTGAEDKSHKSWGHHRDDDKAHV
jgi:hypothetical protein